MTSGLILLSWALLLYLLWIGIKYTAHIVAAFFRIYLPARQQEKEERELRMRCLTDVSDSGTMRSTNPQEDSHG